MVPHVHPNFVWWKINKMVHKEKGITKNFITLTNQQDKFCSLRMARYILLTIEWLLAMTWCRVSKIRKVPISSSFWELILLSFLWCYLLLFCRILFYLYIHSPERTYKFIVACSRWLNIILLVSTITSRKLLYQFFAIRC